jgi:P-type E1-E2 ATPase
MRALKTRDISWLIAVVLAVVAFAIVYRFMTEASWDLVSVVTFSLGSLMLLVVTVLSLKSARPTVALSGLCTSLLLAWAGQTQAALFVQAAALALVFLRDSLAGQSSNNVLDGVLSHPPLVRVARVHAEELVPFSEVAIGDQVIVLAGEHIPLDGRLQSNRATVRRAFEKNPQQRTKGDALTSGDTAQSRLVMIVERTAEESTWTVLARIRDRSERERLNRRNKSQGWMFIAQAIWVGVAIIWASIADRMTGALIALAGTWWIGPYIHDVLSNRTLSRALRRGVFIKSWNIEERSHALSIAVLDKTGTLTVGLSNLVSVLPAADLTRSDVVRLAAAIERGSDHTIARTLLREAEVEGLQIPTARDVRALPGLGLAATVSDQEFFIGSAHLAEKKGIVLSPELSAKCARQVEQGATLVYLLDAQRLLAIFVLHDVPRPSASPLVTELTKRGMDVRVVSGDERRTVQTLAAAVGVAKDKVESRLGPQEKADFVKSLKPATVLMVGDPGSDQLALSQARLAIGFGGRGRELADPSSQALVRRTNLVDVLEVLYVASLLHRLSRLVPITTVLLVAIFSALSLWV